MGIPCSFVDEKTYNVTFHSADFLPPTNPAVWNIAKALSNQAFNETNYKFVILSLFAEIISAIPLFRRPGNKVTIFQDKYVGNLTPETLVVRNQNGIPFFVVGVEKPAIFKADKTKLSLVYGEMFDNLFTLRAVYGVQKPYGIITTYDEYKVCWLPEIGTEAGESDTDAEENEKGVKAERGLCVSDQTWTSFDSQETLKAVATALLDGFNSPIIPPLPSEIFTGPYKLFTPETIEFRSMQIRPLFKFPTSAENFYIIDRFRPGSEGNAYHVLTPTGEQGVLKVFKKDPKSNTAIEKLSKEHQCWAKINGITTRIVTVNSKPALLTPYLKPLSEDEKKDPEVYKQIAALYESCVDKGYFQEDASWCHLGWYQYEDPPTIKLLGFGYIEVFAEPNASEEFQIEKREKVAEMLEMLGYAPGSQQNDGVM